MWVLFCWQLAISRKKFKSENKNVHFEIMSSKKGLQFNYSSNVNPLRKHCSIGTIQSDPNGHFATVLEQIKGAGNYENVLLQVTKINDNLDLFKYVSNLEGMGNFAPKPIHRQKELAFAESQRLEGNGAFKKGNFKQAFGHYSHAVMKAPYPDQGTGKPVRLHFKIKGCQKDS